MLCVDYSDDSCWLRTMSEWPGVGQDGPYADDKLAAAQQGFENGVLKFFSATAFDEHSAGGKELNDKIWATSNVTLQWGLQGTRSWRQQDEEMVTSADRASAGSKCFSLRHQPCCCGHSF